MYFYAQTFRGSLSQPLIAPPDKIAMLSISRSAALGGCQVAPRAAAKNLKSLLQADRIRFFDLQLPA